MVEEIKYFKEVILPKLYAEDRINCIRLIKYIEKEYTVIQELNEGKKVIIENWEASKCPTCKKSFYDYEECDDGYYDRAYHLERCPYCGQKLNWY